MNKAGRNWLIRIKNTLIDLADHRTNMAFSAEDLHYVLYPIEELARRVSPKEKRKKSQRLWILREQQEDLGSERDEEIMIKAGIKIERGSDRKGRFHWEGQLEDHSVV